MVNIISTASELGYLNVPENTLIEIDQMKNYPPETDGADHNRKSGRIHGCSVPYGGRRASEECTIMPNDTVIFSSNPIPGNEKSVSKSHQ